MANDLFTPARTSLGKAEIDLLNNKLKAILILTSGTGSYTKDLTDQYLSEVVASAANAIIATSPALAGKTIVNGVFDADPVVFAAPPAGVTAGAIIIVRAAAASGDADLATSAQRVIAWIDTGTNLPLALNGSDTTVDWDNGAEKVFAI